MKRPRRTACVHCGAEDVLYSARQRAWVCLWCCIANLPIEAEPVKDAPDEADEDYFFRTNYRRGPWAASKTARR